MSILFDLIATQPRKLFNFHGGSEYAKAVFHELTSVHDDIICIYNPSLKLSKSIRSRVNEKRIKLVTVYKYNSVNEIILNHNIKVFYSALPLPFRRLKLGDTKCIFTIHGLRPVELLNDRFRIKYAASPSDYIKCLLPFIPFYKKLRVNQFRDLLSVSSKLSIITDSNHSKFSIFHYLKKISLDNIKIFSAPPTDTFTVNEQYLLPCDKFSYFLVVSGNRWEKNCYRLLKSWSILQENYSDFPKNLIITGFTNNKLKKKFKSLKNVYFLDYVCSADLQALFKYAFCHIYPSLNEGFGYPPINSMRFSVPTIASGCTSIQEICNDAAIYFNPLDYHELVVRILQITYDNALYSLLSKNSTKQYTAIHNEQTEDLVNMIKFILKFNI